MRRLASRTRTSKPVHLEEATHAYLRIPISILAVAKKTSAIRRLARVLAVVVLAGPLKSLAAKAQLGPACGLLPSSCEFSRRVI